MAASVGCSLMDVNFSPNLVSCEGTFAFDFPGVWAAPTSPIVYKSVDDFCEFLRTLAALNGDHAIRRTWIECLRGAAHLWYYHTLPMGTRKYLADAHISEVINSLMGEFKTDRYIFPHRCTHDSPANGSESSYETCRQKSSSSKMAATSQSSQITLTVRPAPNQLGQPVDGRDAQNTTKPCSTGWSPQRGRRGGSRIPRSPRQSPPCDDGTSLLGPEPASHEQFEMADSEYPTHADFARQEKGNVNGHANGHSNGHANGHANGHVSGKGLAGGRASKEGVGRPKLDRDFDMTDAPRTPKERKNRFHKNLTPEKHHCGISKSKSPPKRLTVRNISASELASIVVDGSARRTRSSSA